jgi:hypothetical protein
MEITLSTAALGHKKIKQPAKSNKIKMEEKTMITLSRSIYNTTSLYNKVSRLPAVGQ